MGDIEADKDKLGLGPITVEELKEVDIVLLDPILREHVRDSETGEIIEEEIEEIKGYMRGNTDEYGRIRKYIVAKNAEGEMLGFMGLTIPDPDLISLYSTTSQESSELVNAFVSSAVFRGGGIGIKLFNEACEIVRQEGKKQVLLSSGPRYRESWGFYDKVCDARGGILVNKFGPGRDAHTWRKNLK